jgi:mRNA interferase MazF
MVCSQYEDSHIPTRRSLRLGGCARAPTRSLAQRPDRGGLGRIRGQAQSVEDHRSRIGTIVVLVVTSNMRLLDAPGNVLLSARAAGLPRDSVANVSQIVTIDRTTLSERAGQLDGKTLTAISRGVRLVLDL